jgi:predicted DNA-binding protein (MmcQ/YjbR family)
MGIEDIRDYCLSKKGVTEDLPFDETTLVFKVMGKIFLITDVEGPLSISIKCEPETAVALREDYSAVTPAYHMNKTHWNGIDINGSVPDKLIFQWIDDSYELIIKKLPLKLKAELNNIQDNIK